MNDDTMRRVERACRDLAAERTPITFDAVAARAGLGLERTDERAENLAGYFQRRMAH